MKRLTDKEVIDKMLEVHKGFYDYSKFKYVNSRTKSTIICPKHGEFEQSFKLHRQGIGCKECGKSKMTGRKKGTGDTTKQFIEKAKKVHGDLYDYSKSLYVNNRTKVVIICKEHGEFLQRPDSHTSRGSGCTKCNNIKQKVSKKYTTFTLTNEFNKVHNYKYIYPKLHFSSVDNYINIVCKEHGIFRQMIRKHKDGNGCPKCAVLSRPQNNVKPKYDLIKSFNKTHKNKFKYDLSSYSGSHSKINIICEEHGIFNQSVSHHLNGVGCPKCSRKQKVSKAEQELFNFVYSLNNTATQSDRTILDKKEIDIFIPNKKLGIEFNGLYWHSEIFKDKWYHHSKYVEAKSKGVQLITIYEDDWKYKKELVKSFLKNKLGVFNKKLNARQGIIREVSYKVAKEFLEENHLQGSTSASYYRGLYINDELVSLILFKKESTGEYNLVRFCSKTGYLVRGGFSKLMKNFIHLVDSTNIVTFSDNTYSDGGLYINNNFSIVKTLPPDYKYIIGDKREHKFNYRKKKLSKMFSNTNDKTEKDIMFENRLYRIYDCGKIKYKYNM